MREGNKEKAERVMGMMARWEYGDMKEELEGIGILVEGTWTQYRRVLCL